MKQLLLKIIFVIIVSVITNNLLEAQIKIGRNLNSLSSSGVLLELDDPTKALLLTRVFNPGSVIGSNSYRGMLVYDSSVNKLAYYDGTTWVYPLTNVSSDTSIYKYDGSLISNRRVNLNGKTLSFYNTSDSLYLSGGKVGISVNPISALQVKGAVRTDSLVLLSNRLYKPLNVIMDSIAMIDSVGRLMKVGVNDLLSATPPSSNFDWTYVQYSGITSNWLEKNQIIGEQMTIYGAANGVFSNLSAAAQMSSYMYAKDTLNVSLDVFVTSLASRPGIVGLRLLEYSDAVGTLVQTDTLEVFVRGNTFGRGIRGNTWNKGLSYGKKLQEKTRYIKLEFYLNSNNINKGQGFKSVRIITPTLDNNILNYVQGGNSFGTLGILGLQDKNNLSIITNNTERIKIDSLGRISMRNATNDTFPVLNINYTGNNVNRYTGLMLSMSTGSTISRNSISFYNVNQNRYMGSIWNTVGSAYNSPSIGFSLNDNNNGLKDVMILQSNGNVGIGTNVPYSKLDVLGDIYLTNHGNNSLHNIAERGTRRVGQKAGNTTDGFNGLEFSVDSFAANGNQGSIKFMTWAFGLSATREVGRVNGRGNFGIGVTNPISALHVNGAMRADSLVLNNLKSGANTDSILTINNITGEVRRIATTAIKPSTDTSIYNFDGTLKGNRVVTMGSNSLTFSQTTGTVNFVSNTANLDTGINISGTITNPNQSFLGVVVNSNSSWQTTGLKVGNTNGSNTSIYELNVMGSGQNFGNLGLYNAKSGYSFIVDTLGKVWIGNNLSYANNIASALQVKGAIRADSLVLNNLKSGANTDSILTINNITGEVRRIATTAIKPSIDTSIYSFDGTLKGNRVVTMNANHLTFNSGNGNLIFNPSGTGKIGIGTTIPTQKLTIGNISTSGLNIETATPDAISLGNTFSNVAGQNLKIRLLDNGNSNLAWGFGVSSTQLDYVVPFGNHVFYTSNVEIMRMNFNGVGIGTNNPTQKLDVNGTAKANNLILTGLATGTSSDQVLVIDASNHIKKIRGITNIYNNDGILTGNRIVTMGGNSLVFSGNNFVVLNASIAGNAMGLRFNDNGVQKWHIEKTINNDLAIIESNVAERLRIKAGGNVGIGTASPAQKLDVNGAGVFRGNLTIPNNWVGIGITNPVAPLDIATTTPLTGSDLRYFVKYGVPSWTIPVNTGIIARGNAHPISGVSGSVSIISQGDIVTNGSIVYCLQWTRSDARIKNIIDKTNTQKDLEILQQLQITNYTYKDELVYGTGIQKKVIAQDVEKVYPQAVNKRVEYIPNIFSNAQKVIYKSNEATLYMNKQIDLSVGDMVKLYNFDNQSQKLKVVGVGKTFFTVVGIDSSFFKESIFVYGKEVNDLRTVDYEALSMLNISATQELSKQLMEEKQKVKSQQQKIDQIKTQLDKLEKLILKNQ